MSYCEMF